ncbi:MAG: TetR/AcrR family transcriptional regulator, partial [Candidatus Aminicenantes bacterium]|nr:TetR/AcrR family transcriptional regulator [Candidatus Aminicenantes bacterium]
MKTKSVLSVSSTGDQLRQRLLAQSRELFFRYGFSRVSMDELAEELGISKATIYRYFPDKESLLREVLREVREATLSELEELQKRSELRCREKLMSFFTSLGQTMSLINRELLKDIKFKLPDIWQEIEAFRREKIFPVFCQIVLEGVKKGEIRSDLDARLCR